MHGRRPPPTDDAIDDAIDRAEGRHGEAARVVQMIAARLIELGVEADSAHACAAHVDWHKVETLVVAGCDPDLALEIIR